MSIRSAPESAPSAPRAVGRHALSRWNPVPTLAAAAIAFAAAWVAGWLCFTVLDLLVPAEAPLASPAAQPVRWLLGLALGSVGLPSPAAIIDQFGWRAPFQLVAMAGGGTLRLRSLDDPPVVLQLAAVPLAVLLALILAAFFAGREVQKRWHGGLVAPQDARARAGAAGGAVLSSLLAGVLVGGAATLLAFFTAARIPLGEEFPPRMHAADAGAAMGLATAVAIALTWGRLSAPRLGAGVGVRLRALVPMALAVPLLLALFGIRGRVEATGALELPLSRLAGEHRLGLLALPWPIWVLALAVLAGLVVLASAPRPPGRTREPGEVIVLPLGCMVLALLLVQVTRTSLVIQTGTDGFLGFGALEDHVAWEGSMSLLAPLAALGLGVVVAGIRALRERPARLR